MRWLTGGESHGPALVGVLEGLPAGVTIDLGSVREELRRRRLGVGRGSRQLFERDNLEVLGGLRFGESLGSPIAVRIENSEWSKWSKVMSAIPVGGEGVDGGTEVGAIGELARNRPLTRPRPGHADLAGMQKYGFSEARPVLERASARETACRVALGAFAKAFLQQVAGIEVLSHTVRLGRAAVGDEAQGPTMTDRALIDEDPCRCFSPEASERMAAEVDEARRRGETLGGITEILVEGCPAGLGSYVHWDRRLDARFAGALMSIPAIKGVEVGDGFGIADRFGSEAHDELAPGSDEGVRRTTNRAGGLEGGVTNGETLRFRAAMKPISTVPRGLASVDLVDGRPAKANHQRSDICALPAAGVVGEAMVALILAEAFVEKFGGDNLEECRRNYENYEASLPAQMRVLRE